MARPREFDRTQALAKAMTVFWVRGYEATSMTDLCKALGIGRQSLYSTFGGKQQIYEEALTNYVQAGQVIIQQALGPQAGLPEVRAFLRGTAESLSRQTPRMGCMIMNACVDRAPHDERTAEQTYGAIVAQRVVLTRALHNARERGELPAHANTQALASFLTSQLAGMSALSRAGAPENELISIADTAFAALTAPALPPQNTTQKA